MARRGRAAPRRQPKASMPPLPSASDADAQEEACQHDTHAAMKSQAASGKAGAPGAPEGKFQTVLMAACVLLLSVNPMATHLFCFAGASDGSSNAGESDSVGGPDQLASAANGGRGAWLGETFEEVELEEVNACVLGRNAQYRVLCHI